MTAAPPTLVQVAVATRGESAALIRALGSGELGHVAAVEEESGQVLLRGGTEEQLDTAVATLRTRHALDLTVGETRVVCRETLARRVEIDMTHKRRIAGGGVEYARMKIVLAPDAASSFETCLPQGSIPPDLLAGAERGIARAFRAGALAGFPVVEVAAMLVDGAWHENDSTPLAFETAAVAAVREAQRQVGVLLEPIMQVEIVVPAAYADAVHRDLAARRGTAGRLTARDDGTVAITAEAPLAALLGYERHLHRLTEGSGRLTMAFDHFAPVDPPDPPRFRPAAALRIA